MPGALPVHHVTAAAALRAYDVRQSALFLIRPDNYVGCATDDPRDILDHLPLISG
ncbi:hypothetical protein ACWT_1596 [Actinoplanes sp. SE50]|uniref:hypothetical protein n=1 Tax=unclassified Actinoplanes TaxID=2626549 RepID=UPI00023ECAAB|nr:MULTISPECIES: hypothetical protein [unclassified Actinoplanes]AEV82615.1 hypothetical protein ACPL_1718 [Actinoplanes sp. SE50/110]ATO81011.1 hypothetical protein ACWT_1596 [Actinoplanes sp. SE50]SLL98418.1 hypothetical protein ACSP50_1644 [Actinoplanes sp. SE50/110]